MMIRLGVADLVLVAARVLDLEPDAALDLVDLDAAERALTEPVPPPGDAASRAAAILLGILHHRPLRRGNRRVALIAATQFLALNGWRLDTEPPEDLARVLDADDSAEIAAWLRPRLHDGGTERKQKFMFARSGGRAQLLARFTERGRRVVVLAEEEARLHNHHHVGTEHILLGLIHEGQGVAAEVLESLGIGLEDVRQQVEQIIGLGREAPTGQIPMTPRSRKVLDLALREALRLKRDQVGTEHILLGLVREGQGVAAEALVELGVSTEEVRQQVLHLIEIDRPHDARLRALRQAEDVAIDSGDFEQAARLRAQERELLLPGGPGEENDRLRRETDRLRGLLRDAGIDPDAGTSRTA